MIFDQTSVRRIFRHLTLKLHGPLSRAIVLNMGSEEFLDLCIRPEDRETLRRAYELTLGTHEKSMSLSLDLTHAEFTSPVRFVVTTKTYIPTYATHILENQNESWRNFTNDLCQLLREMVTFKKCFHWLNTNMNEPEQIRFYLPALQQLLAAVEDTAEGRKNTSRWRHTFPIDRTDSDRAVFTPLRRRITSGKPPKVMRPIPKSMADACHIANGMLVRGIMLGEMEGSAEVSTEISFSQARAVPFEPFSRVAEFVWQ